MNVADDGDFDVRVTSKTLVAHDVVELTLTPVTRQDLPPWGPGAHLDLVLDAVPTRQYSLCGDPSERRCLTIAVLRDCQGSGSSLFVHNQLSVGDTVRVRGPRNHFSLEPSPRYLFIAGGIGITAILPMVGQAQLQGWEWALAYAGRSLTAMAYRDALAGSGDRVQYWPTLSRATGCR